jgi:hypothetical protein
MFCKGFSMAFFQARLGVGSCFDTASYFWHNKLLADGVPFLLTTGSGEYLVDHSPPPHIHLGGWTDATNNEKIFFYILNMFIPF